jgi:hypothetical protein
MTGELHLPEKQLKSFLDISVSNMLRLRDSLFTMDLYGEKIRYVYIQFFATCSLEG